MNNIPVELQETVCEHCTPRALASLTLTSTHFLNVSRPVLYRHVTIYAQDNSLRSLSYTVAGRNGYVVPYKRFRETVISSPGIYGPLVKSLHLYEWSPESGKYFTTNT